MKALLDGLIQRTGLRPVLRLVLKNRYIYYSEVRSRFDASYTDYFNLAIARSGEPTVGSQEKRYLLCLGNIEHKLPQGFTDGAFLRTLGFFPF